MPELPEVEVNRKGLDKLVKDKKIKNINVFW
ncbi:MAG: DNA-formamidopyrimidine glycosylase family protein, partial [Ruoffia tabacinasalis]